jgi:A/G-specific adenine glycosylase
VHKSVVRAFRRDLPRWFAKNSRVLPWRENRTPYRVWISELMLQQTRVDQVVPYFNRFLKRFPSVGALARAPRHDVLKLWEGLGYYSRAIRAHETAKHVAGPLGGKFPDTFEGLLALPGVGPYTAAAVGSLAFGLDAAVVDGNVARVLARAFACDEDVGSPSGKRRIQSLAETLLPRGRAGEFNEAMMELGATVCLPRSPKCEACPLRRICRGRAEGDPERYPVKKKKAAVPHKHVGAGIVVDRRGRYLIAQRKEGSMLGGLWEFPGGTREEGETIEQCIARELQEELGIDVEVGAHVITVRHAFSHFTMDLHAHACTLAKGRPRAIDCAAWKWAARGELRRYPFGRADRRIIDAIESAPRLV